MKRLFAVVIATSAIAGPPWAEFFIVRDSPSAPCKVVMERPTDTKIVIVGNKNGYKEQTEAVAQVSVLCK